MGNFRKSCIRAGKIIYRCMQCGVDGVKLWREYNSGPKWELFCAECAAKSQNHTAPIKPDGSHETPDGKIANKIGGLIPAIPAEEGSTFWGVRGVSARLKRWWESLPLKKGGPRGSDARKPGELMDLLVEYVKLSREKTKVETRQEEIKEQVDEALDLLGTQDFSSDGYGAQWITSSWTDFKGLVEKENLAHLLPDYKREKPSLRITGPRE